MKYWIRLLARGLSLNMPFVIDYFILPNNLYKNLQKCTYAINSFDINFLSYFDIVSAEVVVVVVAVFTVLFVSIEAVIKFFIFSIFFTEMFCNV